MVSKNEDKALEDLDETFRLMKGNLNVQLGYQEHKKRDQEWKQRDPAAYKRDMELMCRRMCGDDWKAEYEAMLREEFPEEYEK